MSKAAEKVIKSAFLKQFIDTKIGAWPIYGRMAHLLEQSLSDNEIRFRINFARKMLSA